MKKLYLAALMLLLSMGIHANQISLQDLISVNVNWLQRAHEVGKLEPIFLGNQNDFNQKIQAHLTLVANHLRSKPNQSWTQTQLQHRTQLINQLELYAKQGTFPVNTFLNYQNPVFIDNAGTHCAVGYLIQQSGHEAIAQEINETQRFAYIKEINHPKLSAWADEFGFTLDELAWIQPGYPSTKGINKVSQGVNGTVNAILEINSTSWIIGGDFTTELKENLVCNHLAMVNKTTNGYEITPMQNGVNGSVKCLLLQGNLVYIGGQFTNANGVTVSNIVRYNLLSSSQPYEAVGSFPNPVTALTSFNNEIIAASKTSGDLISKLNGTQWTEVGSGLYGNEVRCFQAFNNELFIGGDFELPTGALRKHIAIYNPAGIVNATHMGNLTPVNCFSVFNDSLYAGCDFYSQNDSCCISQLTIDSWKSVIKPGMTTGLTGQKILSMCPDTKGIHIFGDFKVSTLMYISQHHGMLKYQSGQPYLEEGVNLDYKTHCSALTGDKIFFGGTFTQNLPTFGPNLDYTYRIAYISASPSALQDAKQLMIINLSPNPAADVITLSGDALNFPMDIAITNSLGQTVLHENISSRQINILNLTPGVYYLNCRDKTGLKGQVKFEKLD